MFLAPHPGPRCRPWWSAGISSSCELLTCKTIHFISFLSTNPNERNWLNEPKKSNNTWKAAKYIHCSGEPCRVSPLHLLHIFLGRSSSSPLDLSISTKLFALGRHTACSHDQTVAHTTKVMLKKGKTNKLDECKRKLGSSPSMINQCVLEDCSTEAFAEEKSPQLIGEKKGYNKRRADDVPVDWCGLELGWSWLLSIISSIAALLFLSLSHTELLERASQKQKYY